MNTRNPFSQMDDETLSLVDMADVYTLAAEACGSVDSIEFDTMFDRLSDLLYDEQYRRWKPVRCDTPAGLDIPF